ncbi:MAG: hypothetical protein ACJAYX_003265 [Planctomycetota bacterium]
MTSRKLASRPRRSPRSLRHGRRIDQVRDVRTGLVRRNAVESVASARIWRADMG